jgi:TPR repeat protein
VQYFKDAADGNILEAKYKYALMIRSGDGIERNHDESNKALEICGDRGEMKMQYDVAMTFLGDCHPTDTQRSEVTAQDLSLGHKYLKLAADNGHSEAQYKIGISLLTTESDPVEAARYLKMSSDQKHRLGVIVYGFVMLTGYGITQNIEEGIHYLEEIDNSCDSNIAFKIANALFAYPDHQELATRYLKLAVDHGHSEAAYRYARLLLLNTDLC